MTRFQACCLLLLGQLALCAWAHFQQPPAVSDDDYARVVIAQQFAASPQLDPSGTSWLPLPFWLMGGVMLVSAATLEVARVTALLGALGAALLLYGAARNLGLSRPRAAISALLASVLPTHQVLLLATVPEFWTAALAVYGLSTLAADEADFRGALALSAASFCRYEMWALCAGYALVIAARATSSRRGRQGRPDIAALSCSLLALSGITVWLSHGQFVHGSPLFFLARVQHYKAALGADARSTWELYWSYPWTLLSREPEVTVLVAWTLVGRWRSAPQADRLRLRKADAILLPLALGLFVLVAGDVRGGAPTHHPERALVAFWMLALPVGLSALDVTRPWKKPLLLAASCALVALPLRLQRAPSAYADRADEEAIGKILRERLPADARVVLATDDYGYFAIQAAAGHPGRFLVSNRHDPRERRPSGSPFEQALALARESAVRHLVAPVCWDFEDGTTLAHSRNFRLLSL